MKKQSGHSNLKLIITAIFVVWLAIGIIHQIKPMPHGTSVQGEIHVVPLSSVEFLHDITYNDEEGNRVLEQEIFDEVFETIDEAERFIIVDMFLFNQDYSGKDELLPLSTTLKDKLIAKKQMNPDMHILFITDEINNFYGSYENELITDLKANNIDVVITDLTKLRDSNMVYSSFWRTYLQWFGTRGEGWITHPLGNTMHEVTLRSFLKLMNTKANHRKVLVADSDDSITTILTSANPHDASGFHSNIAFKVTGAVYDEVIASEQGIAAFSGTTPPVIDTSFVTDVYGGEATVQFISEGAIKRSLLAELDSTQSGDAIDVAMFYLSDKQVVQALRNAAKRGVHVRLILDPNKDAFAREKNGIPNRQVAAQLVKEDMIELRWYNTNGEQYHTKMIVIRKADGTMIIYAGSANITRRNIDDFNLEANLRITVPIDSDIAQEIRTYYARLWNNIDAEFTLEYEAFRDDSMIKKVVYHLQESTGLSTF